MRNRKDSNVIIFNGNGFEYAATLLNEDPKCASVLITNKTQTQRESPVRITLLQGVSRNDRMDACIQKSTELGVNEIIPIICERTTFKLKDNRSDKKIAHWNQIITSACEQSGRCELPILKPIISFQQALHEGNTGCKFVLDPDSKEGLKNVNKPGDDICILVGPEGGLTQNEIEIASDMSFTGIQLGPRILRTETAGPACIAAMQTLWGDLGG
jgi:16S rRNA (uracil1498-N3)-methyltransferase